MIRYALTCEKAHAFESWFPNSDGYDRQVKRGLVTCPVCGSAKVAKAIMAPRLARTDVEPAMPPTPPKPTPFAASPEAPVAVAPPEKTPVAILSPQEQVVREKLKELRDHLTRNSDNVGERFPDEARKMHYGEIDHRSIYGQASPDEAKALAEEGIPFHPLPVLPDERN